MSVFACTHRVCFPDGAVVRARRQRFGIAATAPRSWEGGAEKVLDGVLQTHTVFVNASKGQAAKKEDLILA